MFPVPLENYRKQSYDYFVERDPNSDLKIKVQSRRLSAPSNLKKITPAKPSKRKLSGSSDISTDSKSKMAKSDIEEMMKGQLSEINKLLSDVKDDIKQSLNSDFTESLKPVKEKLDDLSSQYASMERKNEERDEKLEKLNTQMLNMKDTLKGDILKEIGREMNLKNENAHKAMLAKEIEKCSVNVVVHGFKSTEPEKDIRELAKKMQSKEPFNIIKVTTLGKGKEEKPPPILIVFGTEFQRNNFLKNAKDFPKGAILEKDIPVHYREEFKKFRREQWKNKSFFGVQAQIIFTGHLMQLRYRDDPTKAYTILKEFFPSEEHIAKTSTKGNKNDLLPPSNSIDKDAIDVASKTVIWSGIKSETPTSLREILGTILDAKRLDQICEIKINNGKAKLICRSPTTAKSVFDATNGRSVGDTKINLSLFNF